MENKSVSMTELPLQQLQMVKQEIEQVRWLGNAMGLLQTDSQKDCQKGPQCADCLLWTTSPGPRQVPGRTSVSEAHGSREREWYTLPLLGFLVKPSYLTSPESLDKRLLAPLTESLYVPGLLANIDRVIVDVGTGYLAEMVRLSSVVSTFYVYLC